MQCSRRDSTPSSALTCDDGIAVWPLHYITVDVQGRQGTCRRSKGAQVPPPATAHVSKQLAEEGVGHEGKCHTVCSSSLRSMNFLQRIRCTSNNWICNICQLCGANGEYS
ncbi:hypothetical protein DUNSADRAFT_2686 [Dunaliella salina]|uniref:Encoded protein n=1 Tax=Dunaliella salina TaxID=3046 RepID=A0ABQ7H894_DUNSA|nr:hypothetical protein DUNSADRAFT_2686 [Dunaliella salina]|eukprot:KAF5843074.1 hypothetical protein DUNSADRAFT_2686 [Dunaliella salina]